MTDHEIDKRQRIKEQTMMYRTQQRNPKIEQHCFEVCWFGSHCIGINVDKFYIRIIN